MQPRNIMLEGRCKIKAIVDWDDCGPIEVGGYYARRALSKGFRLKYEMPDWDPIFLEYSADRFAELSMVMETLERREPARDGPPGPPLVRFPLGRNIGPLA